jgi:Family of unknown function (DUF6174)
MSPSPGSSLADDASVEQRREAWEARGIEDYTWTFTVAEPIFGPKRITARVRRGELVEATIDGKVVAVDDGAADGRPATVDAVFDVLIEASNGDPNSLTIGWDEDLGFPASYDVDYSDAFDDEVTFRVPAFDVNQNA